MSSAESPLSPTSQLSSLDEPLSSYDSEDFDDVKPKRSARRSPDADKHNNSRPTKRQRRVEARHALDPPPQPEVDLYENEVVSDDTDGSVPASPSHPGDEDMHERQVTWCKWDGCQAGDVGNMDKLVEHLHEDHIGVRQKKYSCEWVDCSRKGIPHASGYALRAHMRSHTREKPFFCTLPECDRSFTRSDALAKHMRTVHETEALRPSDPVPKHHSSNVGKTFQRLKLILNKNNGDKTDSPAPVSPAMSNPMHPDPNHALNNVQYYADSSVPGGVGRLFPSDIQFTPEELAMPADQLYQLLRRQQHWALEESEDLKTEFDNLEKKRFEEWMCKELVLENAQEADLMRMMRNRQEMGVTADGLEGLWRVLEEDIAPNKALDIKGAQPWWRTVVSGAEADGEVPDLRGGAPRSDARRQAELWGNRAGA